MEDQVIVINNVDSDIVQATIDAIRNPQTDPAGHRTRPGLSPRMATQELLRQPNISRAVVVSNAKGAVLAVLYQPGSKEAWEAIACCGFPQDDLYRQAYSTLFKDEERAEPAEQMPVSNPPTKGPRDPRPVVDGWGISVWFTEDNDRQTAHATRLIVRRYEDHLNPDLDHFPKQTCVIRRALSGE